MGSNYKNIYREGSIQQYIIISWAVSLSRKTCLISM